MDYMEWWNMNAEAEDSNSSTSSDDSDDEDPAYADQMPGFDLLNPTADAPAVNYLQSALPKSINNQEQGEHTAARGSLVVQCLSRYISQQDSKPDTSVRTQAPQQLTVGLYNHQQHALAWMLWRESRNPAGGILADETGLGKTVTTIALILKSLQDERPPESAYDHEHPGGNLIVCPADLIPHWRQELESKGQITDINVFRRQQEIDIAVLSQSQVVITSYETLGRNFITQDKILFNIYWKRVIVDEAHVIKNPHSRRSIALSQLKAEKRWALTATPTRNTLDDILPILMFLRLTPFYDMGMFYEFIANNDPAGTARFHCIRDCLILRRTKNGLIASGLMPELSPMTSRIISIDLLPEERLVYDEVMTYSRIMCSLFIRQTRADVGQVVLTDDHLNKFQLTTVQKNFLLRRGMLGARNILTLILRLRQICSHPALFGNMLTSEDFRRTGRVDLADYELEDANREILGVLAEFNGEIDAAEGVVDQNALNRANLVFTEDFVSSKMKAILNLVQEIMQKGEKVIIVSDWVNFLLLIGRHLADIPVATYEVYSGATSLADRERILQSFNSPDQTNVLLLSMGIIGHGLDLRAANHLIIADVHWDPLKETEVQSAIHRVGQTRDVVVYKFVCRGTIEEGILTLLNERPRIRRELGLREMASLLNM